MCDAPRRSAATEYLADLKQREAGDILMFGGPILWNALRADDLVDELHVMVGPFAIGAGTPLFTGPPDIALSLIESPRTWDGSGNVLSGTTFGGVTPTT